MPRMQVYLPDELYRQVKEHGLPASELLQEAVRAELRRRALLTEVNVYLTELVAEVGQTAVSELVRAEAVALDIRGHHFTHGS